MGGEAGARAAADPGIARAGEDARGLQQVIGRDAGPIGGIIGREGGDRRTQRLHSLRVGGDEILVLQPFRQDDMNHRGEDGDVLTGARLHMDMGAPGGFSDARVDDDQFRLRLFHVLEHAAGILPREAGRLADDGIDADQQPGVGGVELRLARLPHAVMGERDEDAGLVDRACGEEHRRSDATQPAGGHAGRRDKGDEAHADIHRHRAGTVFGDDRVQLRSDLVHRRFGRNGREAPIRPALEAVEQPLVAIMLFGQGAPLGTAIAAIKWGAGIAGHLRRPAVFHRHLDRAIGRAQTADAGMDLRAHANITTERAAAPPRSAAKALSIASSSIWAATRSSRLSRPLM